VFHPNEKVRDIGKLYRCIKNDEKIASDRLKHMFRGEATWLVCDNMVFVHLMSFSQESNIRQRLLNTIRQPRIRHPNADIREILKAVFRRTQESLAAA